MEKEKKKVLNNSALILLTISNIILCIRNGFNMISIIAIVLSIVVFILDILDYFS